MGSVLADTLFDNYLLASIPASTFENTDVSDEEWFSEYNVAAWLGFACPPKNKLDVVLRYVDGKGVHEAQIDQCLVLEDLQMMLAGRVSIRASGAISKMLICCRGIEPGSAVRVDELFVQRVEETAALLRRARIVSMT